MTYCIIALGVLLSLFSEANEAQHNVNFQPRVLWANGGGDVQTVPYEYKLRWFWKDLENIGVQRPHIEMDLILTGGYRVLQLVNNPLGEKVDDTKLRLLLDGEVSSFHATIESPNGYQDKLEIAIQIPVGTPESFVHESCREMGIAVRPDVLKRTHLYSALLCKETGDYTNIYIHHSKGRNLTEHKRRVVIDEGPNDGHLFKVSVQFKKYEIGDRLSKFSVARDGEVEKSTFDIIKVDPKTGEIPPKNYANDEPIRRKKKRFNLSGGFGFTYLKYSESPLLNGNVDLSEIALTLKLTASYKVSDRVSLGANTFGNAFAITKSPSDVSQARFFGLNGRIGYKLGFSNEQHSYYVNFGWYLWGMLVSGNTYGVDKLTGPQVLFLARLNTNQKHPIYAYFKLAPVFVNSRFSLSNREVAIGGGYQLTDRAFGSVPLNLTLDIAFFGIESLSPQREIDLTSISLGVSMPF